MKITWRILAGLLLLLGGASAALAISSPSGLDSRLRFEWDVRQTRANCLEIQGYIYNDYMRAANNVRLLVETLDANGQVVDRTYGFVFGIVPVLSRAPFDVPLKRAGASYRITVTSFEWRDGGGGGGG
jgi:hypothetical protein